MEKLPGQPEEQRPVALTYRAEIFVQREGEEVRLGTHAQGNSIRELADDLVAKGAELESEAKETLGTAENERDKRQRAERSGRRRRSWE
jgi:hypothetical protein